MQLGNNVKFNHHRSGFASTLQIVYYSVIVHFNVNQIY